MSYIPFLTLLPLLLLLLLPTSTLSADTCSSSNLAATAAKYTKCTSLPTLSATLHYTYIPSNKTLSIAFTAIPPTPTGFIAWGINPTATGMVGSQALVAFKSSSGTTPVVSTYNLTSYAGITPAPLSFPVYSKRVEFNAADGSFTIFASVMSDGGKVNLVWQVGPVVSGVPSKHASQPENLSSKTTIDFSSAVDDTSSSPSGPTSGDAPPKSDTPSSSVAAAFNHINMAFLFILSSFVFFAFLS